MSIYIFKIGMYFHKNVKFAQKDFEFICFFTDFVLSLR